jgi:tryptophan 2,3-dioxygenase
MKEMELSPEVLKQLERLQKKYAETGQDLASYLEGLYHTDYLTYWDYIHLDTLLSLQNPKTDLPDEEIFIMYHQITELYFKLALHEMKQLSAKEDCTKAFFINRLQRINRYFEALTKSFEVMTSGMSREQFLQFRLALQPASGFQSAQYRMIEILSTDFIRLVSKKRRAEFEGKEAPIEELYQHMYWKEGANETKTGKKAYTVVQFDEKYSGEFIKLGKAHRNNNIWQKYLSLPADNQKDEKVINQLREFDINVNVNWPLMHLKSAVRYLIKKPDAVPATGGTNWQEYLPPHFQKRIFYPQLWSDREQDEWGKKWVESVINEVV